MVGIVFVEWLLNESGPTTLAAAAKFGLHLEPLRTWLIQHLSAPLFS